MPFKENTASETEFWTVCPEEEAEIIANAPRTKTKVFLRSARYDEAACEKIIAKSKLYCIEIDRCYRYEYGHASCGSETLTVHATIQLHHIVVENGEFAGIIESADGSVYSKGNPDATVALISHAPGYSIRCGQSVEGWDYYDHDRSITVTHYLAPR